MHAGESLPQLYRRPSTAPVQTRLEQSRSSSSLGTSGPLATVAPWETPPRRRVAAEAFSASSGRRRVSPIVSLSRADRRGLGLFRRDAPLYSRQRALERQHAADVERFDGPAAPASSASQGAASPGKASDASLGQAASSLGQATSSLGGASAAPDDAPRRVNLVRVLQRYETLSPAADPHRAAARRAAHAAYARAAGADAAVAAGAALARGAERVLCDVATRAQRQAKLKVYDAPRLDLHFKGEASGALDDADRGDAEPAAAPAPAAQGGDDLEARQESTRALRDFFDGTVGRLRFFQSYKDACALEATVDDPALLDVDESDPVWIARDLNRVLVRNGAAPQPALLKIRGDGDLRLNSLGLPDAVALALAAVLPRLGHVRHVDVSDNRLGDAALALLVDAISAAPQILSLDVSKNDVGGLSAKAVRRLLACRDSRLRILKLRAADVDDSECAELCQALGTNEHLADLDLGGNFLGSGESKNTVDPDTITGPEAIAASISGGGMRLRKLDLSWNYIRGESAVCLAVSLRESTSLQDLDLAYNCFGEEASMQLGVSLARNGTLERLDLSYNSVPARAVLVVASCLKTNVALRRLNLDGNPIGHCGASALTGALQVRSGVEGASDLDLSIMSCETNTSPPGLFDATEPGGTYQLDLARPYDRMVAMELLALANTRDHCAFSELCHTPAGEDAKGGRPGRDVKLHRGGERLAKSLQASIVPGHKRGAAPDWPALGARAAAGAAWRDEDVRSVLGWMGFQLDEDPSRIVREELARRFEFLADVPDGDAMLRLFWGGVFRAADTDTSQCIGKAELARLISLLGADLCDAGAVDRLMRAYDGDKTGLLDEDEFAALATATFAAAPRRRKGPLCEAGEVPWAVPESGILEATLDCAPGAPSVDEVGTDSGVAGLLRLLQAAESERDRTVIFDVATSGAGLFLAAEQALRVFATAAKTSHSAVQRAARLLPRLATPADAAAFIEATLTAAQKQQLRSLLDQAWGPLVGLPTGHYALDLRRPADRLAARKLAGIANAQRSNAQAQQRGDTSQHGNGYDFRNERLDHRPLKLTAAWFAKLPSEGVLRFDFVGTERPHKSARAMSDRRFQAFLRTVGLVDHEQSETLRRAHRKLRSYIALHAGAHPDDEDDYYRGYDALEGQARAWGDELEPVPAPQPASRPASASTSRPASRPASRPVSASVRGASRPVSASCALDPYGPPVDEKEMDKVAQDWRELVSSSRRQISPSLYSEAFELSERAAGKAAPDGASDHGDDKAGGKKKGKKAKNSVAVDEALRNVAAAPAPRPAVPLNPTAEFRASWRVVCAIQANVGRRCVSAAQVGDVLQRFPPAGGAARVALLCALFSRVIDLEALHAVVDALAPEEQLEAAHRLGCLNLFNAVAVDRAYILSLQIFDERQMATLLVKLAVLEPGENWVDERFRRKESMPWVPGWQLPAEWEESVIHYGLLEARYDSKGRGCEANYAERAKLNAMFLCGTRTAKVPHAQEARPGAADAPAADAPAPSGGGGPPDPSAARAPTNAPARSPEGEDPDDPEDPNDPNDPDDPDDPDDTDDPDTASIGPEPPPPRPAHGGPAPEM
ncbi:hypothetical protein M885DRAFT_625757 [Pelagophyceae sp. CCMP2097]|nr:hypothetical protein M885DRAFT_625757 [Pelagophyceae sp. CCMP2097]